MAAHFDSSSELKPDGQLPDARRRPVRPLKFAIFVGVVRVIQLFSAGARGRHVEASSRWCAPLREASDHQWRREGLNSKIMSIKRKAGGFHNSANITTAVYWGPRLIPTLKPGRCEEFGVPRRCVPIDRRPRTSEDTPRRNRAGRATDLWRNRRDGTTLTGRLQNSSARRQSRGTPRHFVARHERMLP